MPIRPSSGAEIKPLIAALGGTDDVRREAAIARLAVIGPRAVEHLLQAYPDGSARCRAGILRTLEAIADPRALALARDALNRGSVDTTSAAVGVLRALLATADASKDALDLLVSVALDGNRHSELRLAAFEALRDLPADVVQPIRASLASDRDAAVRQAAGGQPGSGGQWAAVVSGRLPPSAATLKDLVTAHQAARLTELQRLVDHVRAREGTEADAAVRAEWRAVRGVIHQALANRGSRLALYDLRDSLSDDGQLPVTFLAAIEEIGDASCVEALAGAYDASSRSADLWWREHLAGAFRAIVRREGLTRRHLVVKRALARWPDATSDLMARV